ncbi:MAG: anti-sigma factor, partial [Pedobacter sp.]
MNINDYISSGIVESYVLGLADEVERAEFEHMCATHELVREARHAFELDLEKQAKLGAVSPPQHVRNKLFTDLSIERVVKPDDGLSSSAGNGARVVQATGWAKYLAAASVLLLIASTVLNFYLFRQYKDYSERYSSLLASQTQLANNNDILRTSVDRLQNTIQIVRDTNTTVIKMAASKVTGKGSPDPSSFATIYWNKKSFEVYLMINTLPNPASDKQYQLWAIVGGKPVSAGVFD